jgi:hypothetical protein
VRVDWDGEGVATLPAVPPAVESVLVLTAALDDGGLLRLAAARAAGAAGHDAAGIAAVLEDADGTTRFEEVLLSVQYGPDHAIRRIGLELYPEGEEYPVRAAGDQSNGEFDFRLDGRSGKAALTLATSA